MYTPIQLISTRTYALPPTARDDIHYTRFKDYLAHHSPFIYKGEYIDRLVCISTGIVTPAAANADRAIELGELVAYVGARWTLIIFPSSFVSPVSYVDVTK